MKPTKFILILLSLFLMFSCDDKEEELPNELSLDWILLKKGIDEEYVVESNAAIEVLLKIIADIDIKPGFPFGILHPCSKFICKITS